VGVVKGLILPTRFANPVQRVVEPELDMDRLRRRQLPTVSIFRGLMRRLVPAGQWAVRSPMRSIAREIEEVWPSTEL
jgi:microcystin degradation protein MlrC